MPTSNAVRWNGLTPSNAATALITANMVPLSNGDGTVTWTDVASLGGGVSTAVILAPATSARNVVTSTSNTAVELTLTAKSGQTANLFEAYTSAGVQLLTLNRIASGYTLTVNAFSGGTAILGQHIVGTGTGVNGVVDDGTGVLGTVANIASSSSSVAVKATANGSATGSYAESSGGISGKFRSSDAGNTAATVVIQQKGSATAHLASFLSNAGAEMSYVDSVGTFVGPVTALKSATTSVSVSAATAPSIGQVLTATSSTTATWQTPSGGSFSPDYAGVWSGGGVTFYGTLGAAKTAAASGDEVEVSAGTFDENNLFKNGVNWFFQPGAKVLYTGGGTANCAIFDDGANGANTAVTCVIGGYGEFAHTAGDSPGAGIINIVKASQVKVWGSSFASDKGCIRMADSSTYTATLHADVKTITCSGGVGTVRMFQGDRMYVRADLIENTGTQPALIAGDDDAAGRMIVDAGRISAAGHDAVQATNAAWLQLTVIGDILSANQYGVAFSSSGTVTIRAASITTTSAAAAINHTSSAGTLILDTPTITSNAVTTINKTAAGTLRLLNTRVISTGTNGIAMTLAGGGVTVCMGSVAFISDAGATDSVTAATGQNLTILGVASGNKALNVNVTPLVNTVTYFNDANVV